MRLPGRPIDTAELQETWQPKLWALLIGLTLLVVYAIAFVLQNRMQVSLDFVFATARVSLIWLILLSLLIGILAGLLLSQLYRRRHRRGHEPA